MLLPWPKGTVSDVGTSTHRVTPEGRCPSCGYRLGTPGSVVVGVPGSPVLCHAVATGDGRWRIQRDRGGELIVRCGACRYRLDLMVPGLQAFEDLNEA